VNHVAAQEAGSALTWTWSLPFELTSVRIVRTRIANLLSSHAVERTLIDDACSVMSELVGNALRHARPRSDGQIHVSVVLDDLSLLLSVADGGAATVPSVVSPAPMARSGRGLGIVHTLTHDWGVKESSDGNTVFGILNRA
jgi:anti-sigma regulatory factor (Ser/Thr protein kinase)